MNYAVMLADIDAKIRVLQTLRDVYVKAESLGVLGANSAFPSIPIDAFRDKSIPTAIETYLGLVQRVMPVHEIAQALREGGLESTAAKFDVTVNGALHRMKKRGLVVRHKRGWALLERQV